MKKRIIILSLLCLFILSSTAFATNWVLISKGMFGMSDYLEADNVAKNDNLLLFWYKFNDRGVWKVYKEEENLTTDQYRHLEVYYFHGSQISKQFLTPTAYHSDSGIKNIINMALKYAKDGTDIGTVPNPQ